MAKKVESITIIGSGNVATHLAVCFYSVGIKIDRIISKTLKNAQCLAVRVGASSSTDFADIPTDTGIVFIVVSDNAIKDVVDKMQGVSLPFVHTSGSMPLSVLGENKSVGVFYPFQSFSKEERTGELKFPICIEANSEELKQQLAFLAGKISDNIVFMDSAKRKKLHLSGILANNFTNHLIARANDFMQENELDPTLLNPIIEETLAKIKINHPKLVQTGPAVRGDMEVIKNHLALLNNNSQLSEIYRVMTESIKDYYKTEEE